MIQITYQKANGDIFKRIRNTFTSYRVGETTSMGWKVLDIQYNYNGKFYSKTEYDDKISFLYNKEKNKFKLKNKFNEIYKSLGYVLSLLVLWEILEITIKGIL